MAVIISCLLEGDRSDSASWMPASTVSGGLLRTSLKYFLQRDSCSFPLQNSVNGSSVPAAIVAPDHPGDFVHLPLLCFVGYIALLASSPIYACLAAIAIFGKFLCTGAYSILKAAFLAWFLTVSSLDFVHFLWLSMWLVLSSFSLCIYGLHLFSHIADWILSRCSIVR